jgi:hypothetical protein
MTLVSVPLSLSFVMRMALSFALIMISGCLCNFRGMPRVYHLSDILLASFIGR